MTAIDVTTMHEGVRQTGYPGSVEAGSLPSGGISQAVIDQGVSRGRQLRSQAFGHAVKGFARWAMSTVRTAAGRRASNRLGCGECGDMMRA